MANEQYPPPSGPEEKPPVPEKIPVIVTPPLPEPLDPNDPNPMREQTPEPAPFHEEQQRAPEPEEIAPNSDAKASGIPRWQNPLSRHRRSA